MPVLCTPIWQTPPSFSVFRPHVGAIVHGWTPNVVVQYGQHTVLRETVFGGFEHHIKFSDKFWQPQRHAVRFDECLEDFYVTFPGSNTPVAEGPTVFRLGWAYPYNRLAFVIDNAGWPHTEYTLWDIEPDPTEYLSWSTPLPPTPFKYT